MVPQVHPEANKRLKINFFISLFLVVYARKNISSPYLEQLKTAGGEQV
ncbi:hypothetical protein B712_0159 [Chlamydia psittaci NJ1]|nr:hypothetical protein B712_0159 [Chlamydia psittaci NJ1]